MAGTDIMPSVLLQVMQWCRRFVPFDARLAVGFCVCKPVDKSVMQGICGNLDCVQGFEP